MAPRRTGVTAPPFTPRTGGLFTVAPPVEFGDVHERGGVDYRDEPYAAARSYADACETPAADRSKTFDRTVAYRDSDAFTVIGGDVCSPVGIDLAERDRRSIAALQNGEERAVEAVLWTGVTSNGESIAPAFVDGGAVAAGVATAVSLRAAVAALEAALALAYGGVGVIHMTVETASFAASDGIIASPPGASPRLTTPLGTLVVAGAGYPGTGPAGEAKPAGGAYLYGTGPLLVRRGPIDPLADFAGSFDRSVNNLVRVGERTYVVSFTGPLLFALADHETP